MLPRVLVFAMITLASIVCDSTSVSAQQVEIVSKADAVQLFTMSRREWEANITAAVAAGMATRTPPSASGLIGMSIRTPEGYAITRLDYSEGDARPSWVQLTVTQPREVVYTEAIAQELFATVQRQMAPEFEVVGNMEKIEGVTVLLFLIREAKRAR